MTQDAATESPDLLLYGSYGYTGTLIARRAREKNVPVILAGRAVDPLHEQADALEFPARAFGLNDPTEVTAHLGDVEAVLNCAGPFAETYRPLVEGCLRAGTDYVDITGEVPVFENLRELDGQARDAGVTLLPGAGFDIVPSDCLAAFLADRHPEADHLTVGYLTDSGLSRGTLKTALVQAGQGGLVRRDGKLRRVPGGWGTRAIDFGTGPTSAITVPLGDVVTAFHTTGIGNIDVYLALPSGATTAVRAARYARHLLQSEPIRITLQRVIDRLVTGPDEQARTGTEARLWAEVRTDATSDERNVARLRTPNPYTLTARTALRVGDRVAAGEAPNGYQTPAAAFGSEFVLEFDGVTRQVDPAST